MQEEREFRLDKSKFAVVDVQDGAEDLAYWLTRPPEERLAFIQYLREMMFRDAPTQTGTRLQRFFEVVEQ